MSHSHYHHSQPGQYRAPQPPPRPKRSIPAWAWVIVGIVAIPMLLMGGCAALFLAGSASDFADDPVPVISTDSPAPEPTETTTPEPLPTEPTSPPSTTHKPAEKAPSYLPEDGTLLVGKDVKPGTYQTRVLADDFMPSCYWSRLDKNEEIIDNDLKLVAGALMTLKVRPTDYAVEIRCSGAKWKRVGQ